MKKGHKLDNKSRKEILKGKMDKYTLPRDSKGHIIWIGPVNKTGCGQFGFSRSNNTMTAIQGAWELANKKKCKLIHTCDRLDCVAVEHLAKFVGLIPLVSINNTNKKLNDNKVRAIRRSKKSNKYLAKKYGVTRESISKIKRRISWKHVK